MPPRSGRIASSVANYLRLLRLPAEVRAHVASGALSMGHARALLALDARGRAAPGRRATSWRAGCRCARPRRSSRRLAAAAAAPARRRRRPTSTPARPRSACASSLGTRVRIARRRQGGPHRDRLQDRGRAAIASTSSSRTGARGWRLDRRLEAGRHWNGRPGHGRLGPLAALDAAGRLERWAEPWRRG